jgi:hypothetical protein
LSQSLIKLPFFRRYPAHQNSVDFNMKSPKFINGHQFKIVGFHVHIPLIEPLDQGGRRELRSVPKRTASFAVRS